MPDIPIPPDAAWPPELPGWAFYPIGRAELELGVIGDHTDENGVRTLVRVKTPDDDRVSLLVHDEKRGRQWHASANARAVLRVIGKMRPDLLREEAARLNRTHDRDATIPELTAEDFPDASAPRHD